MKKTVCQTLLSLILTLALISSVAIAQETKPMGDMKMPMHKTKPGERVGKMIAESVVEGHKIAYHILELPGKKERHLMVYITDPAGKPVTNAKVGYLVEGPTDKPQKVMAMAMNEAYGGDVDFTRKGKYTVKLKAAAGEIKLIDAMTYETK